MPIEKIYRPELIQDNPKAALVTVQEFADRHGTTVQVVRTVIARYANKVPGVVKLVNGRQKYYSEEEFLAFFREVTTRTHDRSPLEVAQSEVARIQMVLGDTEERVEKRREDLEKAENDLRKYTRQLKRAQDKVVTEELNEKRLAEVRAAN